MVNKKDFLTKIRHLSTYFTSLGIGFQTQMKSHDSGCKCNRQYVIYFSKLKARYILAASHIGIHQVLDLGIACWKFFKLVDWVGGCQIPFNLENFEFILFQFGFDCLEILIQAATNVGTNCHFFIANLHFEKIVTSFFALKVQIF